MLNGKEIDVSTPYGDCSDKITLGTYMDKKIAFLPRHGQNHSVAPHKINVRGNIWALKELGVTRIIAPCAVGSLREIMKPGDIAIPDQFIDNTKKRDSTFFEDDIVGHVSLAKPICSELKNCFGFTKLNMVKNTTVPTFP